jgi:hypothetical protein
VTKATSRRRPCWPSWRRCFVLTEWGASTAHNGVASIGRAKTTTTRAIPAAGPGSPGASGPREAQPDQVPVTVRRPTGPAPTTRNRPSEAFGPRLPTWATVGSRERRSGTRCSTATWARAARPAGVPAEVGGQGPGGSGARRSIVEREWAEAPGDRGAGFRRKETDNG